MEAATIVSIVALVVSAASAVYAYRQGRRTLRVTTYQGATDLTLQLDQVFIDHPELRPYFYERRQPPESDNNDELRNRVLAAAEYALDIFECIWDHQDTYEENDKDSWRDWINDMFTSAPACRALYVEERDWYPALQKLAAQNPPGVGVPRPGHA